MNEIHIPRWLAMAEDLPMIIEGEVVSETTKGIKIKGSALVRQAINCLRCGKALTNPVSRVVGIGPECCQHWGIERPNYEDAAALAEQLKKVSQFERWFPKAHVKVIGPYVVQGPSPKPKFEKKVWIDEGVIRLRIDYNDKDLAKAIVGARWNPDLKVWEYPISDTTIEDIRFYFRNDIQYDSSITLPPPADDLPFPVPEIQPEQPEQPKDEALKVLYPFQVEGVSFLKKARRCILGDEMGLGKTLQTIMAIKDKQKVLIVVPNTLKKTWVNELVKWVPECKDDIVVIQGTPLKRDFQFTLKSRFVIMNYELVRLHAENLQDIQWDCIVVDEAHKIKNRKAQITQCLKKNAKSDCIYLLSGTPMMNRPDELWSLLNYIQPKVFSSYWKFAQEYCLVTHNGWGYDVGPVNPANLPKLRRILGTLMLRRKKTEVWKDMPPKTIQKLWVELDEKTRAVYKNLVDKMRAEYEGQEISTTIVLALITRLKQLTIDPKLMLEVQPDDMLLEGPKVDALLEIARGTDERIVVFSQYAKAIRALSRTLDKEGISNVYMTGDTPTEAREAMIQKFHTPDGPQVFMSTTQAGGVGITLTAASIAVFMDKMWTPAANLQAQDRIHRIGQEKPCQIIELLAEGTVEEKIEALLESKAADFEAVIEGAAQLRKDQILGLLSLS